MIQYLKKVGVGKERSKDLSYEEAYDANKKVLNAEATDIQIGYFWGAMRMKYETDEELFGFLSSLKEEVDFVDSDELCPLDLAVSYDGKNRSVHILPASIFIATGAGIKIVGHGNEKVPSKFGVTYHEILNAMGCLNISNPDEILKALELSGFSFYHQKFMNPKLASLLPKRQEFGLRNYLNTVEKMLNPFKTTKVIVGVAHNPYISKYIQLGLYSGYKEIFVVKGLEGGIEPFPNKDTKIVTNKIFSLTIRPKELQIEATPTSQQLSIEENANLCLQILKNQQTPFNNWSLITAGLLLIAYGVTEDLKHAVDMAEDSLKTGAAYESFEIYRSLTKRKKIVT
ncbi:MAG: hypothetical protein GXO22_08910 [Aquificae bacterium]|nr:hypothetical protein [Aquificota bacterium]